MQLIQVWEDDWRRRLNIIKEMLAQKLGVSTLDCIGARKTNITEVNTAMTKRFLDDHHIQGFASATHYLALTAPKREEQQKREEPQVVALLALRVEKNGVTGSLKGNIIRYATCMNVMGGFSKLLSFVEQTYTLDSIYTFSDNCVSDGGLYASTGFKPLNTLKPDYMYVVNSVRYHKFGYRLKRFRQDPTLLWEEGLTEAQLAQLNGLPRIWDAGKIKWEKRRV